jgi:hypothetical protein
MHGVIATHGPCPCGEGEERWRRGWGGGRYPGMPLGGGGGPPPLAPPPDAISPRSSVRGLSSRIRVWVSGWIEHDAPRGSPADRGILISLSGPVGIRVIPLTAPFLRGRGRRPQAGRGGGSMKEVAGIASWGRGRPPPPTITTARTDSPRLFRARRCRHLRCVLASHRQTETRNRRLDDSVQKGVTRGGADTQV